MKRLMILCLVVAPASVAVTEESKRPITIDHMPHIVGLTAVGVGGPGQRGAVKGGASSARLPPGDPCASAGSIVYSGAPGVSGTGKCSIVSNGLVRTFRLHVPSSYVPGRSALVISLHGNGTGADGLGQESKTLLSDHADRYGFAVVYPDSMPVGQGKNGWNIYQAETGADDVGFVRAMTLHVLAAIQPDPKRVFLTGHSGGAIFTHLLATLAPDLFAAGAPVSGVIALPPGHLDVGSYPPPRAPISMLMINGEDDRTCAFCGGAGVNKRDGARYYQPSAEESYAHWVAGNRCEGESSTLPLCTGPVSNLSAIDHKKATKCQGGVEVEFVGLRRAGHGWSTKVMHNQSAPGSKEAFNSTLPTLDRDGVSINDLVWRFFEAHPKR